MTVRVRLPASLGIRAATLAIFANAIRLIVLLRGSTDRLLGAVIDPLHPNWLGMQRAFSGFTVYAVSLLGVLTIALLFGLRLTLDRVGPSPKSARRRRRTFALAAGLTALVVLALIEVLLFQDYGVHLYEFAVFGILADAPLQRDLGIQPAEVIRVTVAAAALLVGEPLLCILALRQATWSNGALARACGMLAAVPGGLILFRSGDDDIAADKSDFEGALPFGDRLLLRKTSRPFLAVEARLGANGNPMFGAGDPAPRIENRSNLLFFVTDGLRSDMVRLELPPNLWQLLSRGDLIRSLILLRRGERPFLPPLRFSGRTSRSDDSLRGWRKW